MSGVTEIKISDILKLLLKHIKLVVGSTVIGGLCMFIIFYYLVSPKYTTSTSLYVNNKELQSNTALNINDINASQKLVNTYIVILNHDEVLNRVADQLMEKYSVDELNEYIGLSSINGKLILKTDSLRNVLSMSAVDNTEILRIKAETKNADFSAEICKTIAQEAPSVLKTIVKSGSVEVIGTPKPEYKQSSPNIKLMCAIGAILGLGLAMGILIIIFIMDRTVKGEEDLKNIIDIPILGEIPDFDCFKRM